MGRGQCSIALLADDPGPGGAQSQDMHGCAQKTNTLWSGGEKYQNSQSVIRFSQATDVSCDRGQGRSESLDHGLDARNING